ncbi:toprim domain-containing protein [Candidatus Woesearchaeota archaeon]|nr:toprim domain-containing protein [Candidatus Woesearchaeota archaeon]
MKKNIEKLNEEISKLKQSGNLIIVEGKKDSIALKKLGFKNIAELSKKPLFQIIEDISSKNKECVILTDFDKKGKQLYKKLNSGLSTLGVKVDNRFRKFLQNNTRLSHIEGLDSYLNIK